MTGVGSFVADALHSPEAMPSLKFFLQLVPINGHARSRTALPNSADSGENPNSSAILRGTDGIFVGFEVGFHRFRNRFC